MKTPRKSLLLLLPGSAIGCGSGSGTPSDVAGPCVHGYNEPVITIQTAASQPSGASIARVALSSFRINGQAINAEQWSGPSSIWSNPSFNITVANGVLYCDVPCGFGITEGRYEFAAEVPNHQTINIAVEARYASFQGGCPSFNDDGTNADLNLPEN